MLPGRLPGPRGYLGGEDFMGYEDNMAYCIRKWTSDILLRNYDAVCNDFRCAIGTWWSGEKILDLVWKLRKFCKFCVVGATEISNRELSVTRVDAGSITAVVMLKLKWRTAGNGSVIRDQRDLDC